MLRNLSVLSVIFIGTIRAGPCDIYSTANTPCVAAHSTVRALFDGYSGSMYQVQRASDQSTADIRPLSPGGIANAALQDQFCQGTSCIISIIYDQSGNSNHLTSTPANAASAQANRLPITIGMNQQKAYGVWIEPGIGYRIDNTKGIPIGDQPETIYMVADGTHYNDGCCFDYGNANSDPNNDSPGTVEAIYIGNNTKHTTGRGTGPWIMADLDDGLFGCTEQYCPNIPTQQYPFLVAMLKGQSGGSFALKQGDARSGDLTTIYNGPRPKGYSTMKKEGAIILGIGGNNNNAGAGSFFEGVMVSGVPSDNVDSLVQADIVQAGYGGQQTYWNNNNYYNTQSSAGK